MNPWSKLFGILFLIATGFVVGYHMAESSYAHTPVVTVKLVNASGKGIRTLHLAHDQGSLDVNDIANGASKIVSFYAPGESSYKIDLTFDDDHDLESGKRFVERGLNATETIKELEITPDFQVLKR